MAKHRGTRGGRENAAGGPALWVEERRPFDSAYFGPSPVIHGPEGHATRGRRSGRRRRGVLAALGRAVGQAWSAIRRQERRP